MVEWDLAQKSSRRVTQLDSNQQRIMIGSFVAETAFERLVLSIRVVYPAEKRQRGKPKVAKANKAISNSSHSRVTPEHLARMLNIGLDKAKQMLKVTTQKGVRTAVHPIHIHYRRLFS